jgi:peptidoglycan/LPS O-acetylase OafA/YrhL
MFDRHVDVWLVESLRSRPLGLVAFALLGAVTSLLIAVASYELFEAPLLRLKDRFAPSRAQRDALPRPAVDASSGVVAE